MRHRELVRKMRDMGKVKTKTKAASSRINGRKGGRPKKVTAEDIDHLTAELQKKLAALEAKL